MRLPEDLLRDIKQIAAETGQSLTVVIEAALRQYLSRRREADSDSDFALPVDGKGGLQPNVSLDDGRALRSLLELRGLGKEHWAGIDAADHVETERKSWD